MKSTLLLLLLLGLSACKREEHRHAVEAARPQVDFPKHFDAAWVMSANWKYTMGVAIALSGDRYYYWMYSDVVPFEEGPCSGAFRIEGDILHLDQPESLTTGKKMNPESLYSDRWTILRRPCSVALHSISDKPDDLGRSLLMDVQFDPENPFRNQEALKPEQGVPPNDR